MGVVVVHATPDLSAISDILDSLSNDLAKLEQSWGFEIRLHRVNPASHQPAERAQMVMYSVASGDHPDDVVVFCGEEALVVGKNFTSMVQSKLQSLWILRHTIRGEGHTLTLRNLTIRLANAFVQGNFRGLIFQVEADMPDDQLLAECERLLKRHKLQAPLPKTVAHSRIETAQGYLALHKQAQGVSI